MANPMSTWQSLHVNLARWRQWSKATGATRALVEKLSITTRPYTCAGGTDIATDGSGRTRIRAHSPIRRAIAIASGRLVARLEHELVEVPTGLELPREHLAGRLVELLELGFQVVAPHDEAS